MPALWFHPQFPDTTLLVKKPRKLSWEKELLKVGVSQGEETDLVTKTRDKDGAPLSSGLCY